MKTCCDICLEEFKNRKSMTNHRRWHDLARYKGFQKTFSRKIKIARNSGKWIIPKGIHLNSENGMWRGSSVRLGGLHDWVKRRMPKPKLCECCKKVPPRDLANKSGDYKRDLSDWEYLCRKCHMTKDGRLEKFLKGGKKKGGSY